MDARDALPPTQFATSGDVSIAYQVFGEGPIDIVFVTGIVSHLEAMHDLPGVTDFFRRLATFSRVIVFDKRGQGLSDRVAVAATMDERSDDVRAVMDAAGVNGPAVLCGYSEGASLAAYYAAFHPGQLSHLIINGGLPKFYAGDDYPFGLSAEKIRKSATFYPSGRLLGVAAPSWIEDAQIQDNAARYERLSCSPGNYRALIEMNLKLDARHILPQVRVPTLVLHRKQDQLAPIGGGRYFAEHIPGAKLIEYDGADHWFSAGDYPAMIADIEEFVTGARSASVEEDRILATVLFTDIVGSTERAAQLGDAEWRRLLDEHDRIIRRLIGQHRGRVVKTTGDGVLALFDGPGRAIRCALSLEPSLARLNLSTRAGLHTGEVVERGGDVSGVAVNAAARVMAEARSGEVLVSRVVADLAAGLGANFMERGEIELRGLPGTWRLFAAEL